MALCAAAAVAASGCFTYSAVVTLTPPTADARFSPADEVRAADAVMSAARSAGLELASTPYGYQGEHVYLTPLVRLETRADSADPDVDLIATIQRDKKKIIASIRDPHHGRATPLTRALVEAVRNELGNALPGCHVDTSRRSVPKFLEF
jgi:hypothetical protein